MINWWSEVWNVVYLLFMEWWFKSFFFIFCHILRRGKERLLNYRIRKEPKANEITTYLFCPLLLYKRGHFQNQQCYYTEGDCLVQTVYVPSVWVELSSECHKSFCYFYFSSGIFTFVFEKNFIGSNGVKSNRLFFWISWMFMGQSFLKLSRKVAQSKWRLKKWLFKTIS